MFRCAACSMNIPAKAGIQASYVISNACLDSRLRGNDKTVTFLIPVIYASEYWRIK